MTLSPRVSYWRFKVQVGIFPLWQLTVVEATVAQGTDDAPSPRSGRLVLSEGQQLLQQTPATQDVCVGNITFSKKEQLLGDCSC